MREILVQAGGEGRLDLKEDSVVKIVETDGDYSLDMDISGASVRVFHLSDRPGSKTIRINLNDSSSVDIRNLFIGAGDSRSDFRVELNHMSPGTMSNISSKCIMKDKSRLDFVGVIRVEKNAFGCVGSQDQRAILLSEEAQARFTPMLEIENDDVRVSHSSSIGRIGEDDLFYLMSRGLTEDESRREILNGFLEDVSKEIPLEVEI